jgi:predicted short-subunit dehydrogenase-like oxidoreductase (DUF2520 family)
MLRIAFIGAGNVAWHLAEALEAAGHRITEVFSRRRRNAVALAERLYEAVPVSKPDLSRSVAELVILSVADSALPELLPELRLPTHLNQSHGVFYPLQTFSKAKAVDWQPLPICIEASDEPTLDMLAALASDISTKVYEINSNERKQLHLAAVIACNFANHLWHMASQILKPIGTNLEILHPLLRETLEKAMQMPPYKAQTGPAVRGDISVMEQHIALLQPHSPLWAEIYRLMSQSIADAAPRR